MIPFPRNRYLSIICFLLVGFTATLLMSGFLFQAEAQRPYFRNIVYTESNIPTRNGNTILAFEQDANGKLTPLPNSPFPTGGAGIADPTFTTLGGALLIADNDQNVIVNPEHTRLFAVNSGSNTIAVFDIKKDGTLSPVYGSPFPSGGINPESLGLANDVLYVINRNLDRNNPTQDAKASQPNYTGFRVTYTGQLVPIPKSTVSVPNGSNPTQALISQDKRILFGAEFIGGSLRSFKILPSGRLKESPNSPQSLPASEFPPSSPPALLLGLQVHPKLPILYVGFVTINKVGVYNYNSFTGELTFVKAVPTSGKAPCWLVTNREGTRLYTANTADNSVSVYDLRDATTPKEIQKVVLKGNGSATQLTLNSNESFLQVVTRRNSPDKLKGNGINIFKVNPTDGTLSEEDTSPLPIPSVNGSFPQGIVSLIPKRFAYKAK
ncbi:lactonase family protein [Nostoc sp.]|uniref:lactonase family protein n=1 Tax=Nostoc sp. TaxID=1180 RepID=UPI002FF8C4D7